MKPPCCADTVTQNGQTSREHPFSQFRIRKEVTEEEKKMRKKKKREPVFAGAG